MTQIPCLSRRFQPGFLSLFTPCGMASPPPDGSPFDEVVADGRG
jgi:hypothetical protein